MVSRTGLRTMPRSPPLDILGVVLRALVVGVLMIVTPGKAQSPQPLELVQTIQLPDVRGRVDHFAVDLDGERLFVAALGNNSVEVIDLRGEKRSARLEHLHEPQ